MEDSTKSWSEVIFILRAMVECRNVGAEKMAKHLNRIADGFKIWIHDNILYALFEVSSLCELKRFIRILKRIRRAEFRVIKIQTVREV